MKHGSHSYTLEYCKTSVLINYIMAYLPHTKIATKLSLLLETRYNYNLQ